MATKANPAVITRMTANEIAEGVTDNSIRKCDAIAGLKARINAAVEAGRVPKSPSVKLLAELTGKDVVLPARDTLRTRKQIKRGTPTLAERKANPKAKPATAKPAKAAAKPDSAEDALAAYLAAHGSEGLAEIAAFVKLCVK